MRAQRLYSLLNFRLLFILLLVTAPAHGDTLTTTNSEHFVGKIIEEKSDTIIFQSDFAGRLTIPRSSLIQIERTSLAHTQPPASTNHPPPLLASSFPFPASDSFDWIQLKSGEWLKGTVKSLQDDKLEFDSEEMEIHNFNWKDIRILRTPRVKSLRFEKLPKETFQGSLLITTNSVFVFDEESTTAYPRSDLLAITPTGSRELDKWSANLSVGISFRSGNTKEIDYSADLSISRRTPSTRLNLEYLGNFGEVNEIQTENNHRISASSDIFLSRRLFLRVPDIEYYKDPLQNIDHRLTLGGSVGYDLVHTGRTEWDVTIGPAWQRNWFTSVGSGDTIVDGTALVLSSRFDVELTKRLDLLLEYRGQITRREQGDNLHHAEARLEFEIHKRLTLDVSFIWDRIASPEANSGDEQPQSDDVRLTLGLGMKF